MKGDQGCFVGTWTRLKKLKIKKDKFYCGAQRDKENKIMMFGREL